MKFHYYVAFHFAGMVGALSIETTEELRTAPQILGTARKLRHRVCSEGGIPETNAPELVITTLIPCAAPSPIIVVEGGKQ